MLNDTIVALATPPGRGALAVVRLSGPDALEVAASVFRPATKLRSLPSHTCLFGHLVQGGERIDQVVATVFRAPRSYTGEDTVELTCHGGPVVSGRVLALLRRAGARQAREGEFTQRAFTHGKLDLAQAEAVLALIAAKSAAGAQAALRVLHGALSQTLRDCMETLGRVRAEVEMALDIQEDGAADVLASGGDPDEAGWNARIERVLAEEARRLDRLVAGGRAGRLLEEGVRVVLIGETNAGKSSIFNAFLARDRAIVSAEPGTTRDVLEAWVEWDDLPVALVDTAGLRDHATGIEREGIRRTREALGSATLAILVVDTTARSSDAWPAAERALLEGPDAPRCDLVVALHKWDAGRSSGWERLLEGDAPRAPAEVSARPLAEGSSPPADGPRDATAGDSGPNRGRVVCRVPSSVLGDPGVEPLRRAVTSYLSDAAGNSTTALTVGERQRDLLGRARDAVVRARELVLAGAGGELIAFELRDGLHALGELLGRDADPMLLETIFARFCVGK